MNLGFLFMLRGPRAFLGSLFEIIRTFRHLKTLGFLIMLKGLRALLGSLFDTIRTLKQLVNPRFLNQYRANKYLNYLMPFETPAAVKVLHINSLETG